MRLNSNIHFGSVFFKTILSMFFGYLKNLLVCSKNILYTVSNLSSYPVLVMLNIIGVYGICSGLWWIIWLDVD